MNSMNRIQSKDHRIRTYEINRIFLSSFDDKIYILNNRYDGLALGYLSQLWENSHFDNYSKQLFCQTIIMLFYFLV